MHPEDCREKSKLRVYGDDCDYLADVVESEMMDNKICNHIGVCQGWADITFCETVLQSIF